MNSRLFETRTVNDIPPKSKHQGRLHLEVSDFYFAKVKTQSGEEVKDLVCYDFNRNKWHFLGVGKKDLIEYYVD